MNTRILSKEDVKIVKGNKYVPWLIKPTAIHSSSNNVNKVIVLDLDETLGSFADLYILWRGIRQVWPTCHEFHLLFDLYPEFLRFGILTIMEYLYHCKLKNKCHRILVYTNNQCSVKWVNLICDYIETKIHRTASCADIKLFDQHICAFKINHQQIELERTTHQKRLDDFFRCSKLSENADICFMDDVEYPYMKSSAVYYICPRAYIHPLSTKEIINRIVSSKWLTTRMKTDISNHIDVLTSYDYWRNWFYIHRRRMIRRGNSDVVIDLQISQKIIFHLNEFLEFGVSNVSRCFSKKTRKNLVHPNTNGSHIQTRKKHSFQISNKSPLGNRTGSDDSDCITVLAISIGE